MALMHPLKGSLAVTTHLRHSSSFAPENLASHAWQEPPSTRALVAHVRQLSTFAEPGVLGGKAESSVLSGSVCPSKLSLVGVFDDKFAQKHRAWAHGHQFVA
jgi:hypothetical protein